LLENNREAIEEFFCQESLKPAQPAPPHVVHEQTATEDKLPRSVFKHLAVKALEDAVNVFSLSSAFKEKAEIDIQNKIKQTPDKVIALKAVIDAAFGECVDAFMRKEGIRMPDKPPTNPQDQIDVAAMLDRELIEKFSHGFKETAGIYVASRPEVQKALKESRTHCAAVVRDVLAAELKPGPA
jgi:hypothetical protein